MAYQNVGTPRFYINVYEWLKSNGVNVGDAIDSNRLRTLPVNPTPFTGTQSLFNLEYFVPESPSIESTDTLRCFIALLGHDLGVNFVASNAGHILEIINRHPESGYKGFSIVATETPATEVFYQEQFYEGVVINIGSIVIGTMYDMPHSPELKLTMSREMDGVKKIRTKGGADLVDHKYTGSPLWGDAAPWELYSGTPNPDYHNLSRRGRRVWSLSFNYLQDSDVMGSTESITAEIFDKDGYTKDDWYYSGSAEADLWNPDKRFLRSNNFYSQVIHKTNGGQLPFIFQPDNNNNNPDGFAICRFDQSSFEFNQVANGVYNVKLKIREVW